MNRCSTYEFAQYCVSTTKRSRLRRDTQVVEFSASEIDAVYEGIERLLQRPVDQMPILNHQDYRSLIRLDQIKLRNIENREFEDIQKAQQTLVRSEGHRRQRHQGHRTIGII